MKNIHILLAVITLISFISCDSDSIDYEKQYTSHSIIDSSIKLYTKDGEIKSESTTNDFIKRRHPYLSQLDSQKYEGAIQANYASSDRVELKYWGASKIEVRNVANRNNIVYWEAGEVRKTPYNSSPDFIDIRLYTPLYNHITDLPASSGYNSQVEYKDCFYLKQKEGQLMYPMMNLTLYSTYSTISYFEYNNELNMDILPELAVGDTIIIQQYWVEMI